MPLTTDDFRVLVDRARDGDALAFDRLVRRFQDMAFGYAAALVPDRALAEDVVQEAFLEAYRCLPSLRQSAAFPGWLRRLVFKHCDRATRGGWRRRTVPLETARAEPDRAADVAETVGRMQEARRVRAAVIALPDGEREVTALFYLGGCPTREIAAFLEVPEATVRTRLYRARARLRKELTTVEMTEAKAERPSRDNRLADRILSEIVEEYVRQRVREPEKEDRSLLEEAKRLLDARQAQGTPLDIETVRSGERLFGFIGDHVARADLMRRYLSQPLSSGEEAWARFCLVNALSAGGSSEDVIAEQRKLYDRVTGAFQSDPPRLRGEWGYEPTDDPAIAPLPIDTLPLWAWYIPDASDHWVKAGRGEEWLRRFEEILADMPWTGANRQHRFYFLRIGMRTNLALKRREAAAQCVRRIAALADEETEPIKALHWRGHAIDLELVVRHGEEEAGALHETAERGVALLSEYERLLPRDDKAVRSRFSILRDNLASVCSDFGLHDLAIPLLRAQIDSGDGTPWNYVRLAHSLWATARDRDAALSLIHQAGQRMERGNLWNDWARTLPGFAEIADDPEFIAAAAKPK